MKEDPQIIYEDDYLVAVDKPTGLLVHPDGFEHQNCLTNWIIKRYPEIKDVGETMRLSSGQEIERPGVVHRLDRDTSGAILIARTEESFLYLKSLFKNRMIKKTYHSFVYGTIKTDRERIERPIGKSAKDFRLWSAQRGARGKLREAVTDYAVVERGERGSFLEITPVTGRTHQIRVHMKAVNHPIVCDPLYAPKREPILGFKRLALHASRLELKGLDGKDLLIQSSLPDDFVFALDSLKNN